MSNIGFSFYNLLVYCQEFYILRFVCHNSGVTKTGCAISNSSAAFFFCAVTNSIILTLLFCKFSDNFFLFTLNSNPAQNSARRTWSWSTQSLQQVFMQIFVNLSASGQTAASAKETIVLKQKSANVN